MLFPEEERPRNEQDKVVFIYPSRRESKPVEVKIGHRRLSLQEVRKALGQDVVRLFNSEGAEYFEDDLQYVKNRSVFYATRGEEFDASSCLGEYEMGKKLGEGGFGNVYLAHHKQTGEKVAVKIIKTENIGSAGDIDSIFVEAEILKSLRHENIVQVYNCLTLKTMEVAIIMEYLEGGELLRFVERQRRLDEGTALVFLRQIVKGMFYCHQNNLIHRDLKLENLLLVDSATQKIKIIDFGIAGAISNLRPEDLDSGSLAYMAPECFLGIKDFKADGRIDVWATGVILFSMLHGCLPFKAASHYETIELIKAGRYQVDPSLNLSAGCVDVLSHCLEVNPKKRYTMEEIHGHPWVTRQFFGQIEKPVLMAPIEEDKEPGTKAKARNRASVRVPAKKK